MNTAPFIVIAILLPILAGLYMFIFKVEDRKSRQTFVSVAVIISSICAMIAVLFTGDGEQYKLIQFSEKLSISVHVDGLTKVFASIVALGAFDILFIRIYEARRTGKQILLLFPYEPGCCVGRCVRCEPSYALSVL